MNKLVILIAISIAVGMDVFGQIHRTTEDKPDSSYSYLFQDNDFVQDIKTVYTYNSNKQLTTKVIYPVLKEKNSIDSTVMSYDTNGRIISSRNFINNVLDYSEIWVYDEINKRVDYYEFTGTAFDSLSHTVYKGVDNFDKIPKSIFCESFIESLLRKVIACDTIIVNEYNSTTSSWIVSIELYPQYQNGNPVSAYIKMENFDASIFGMSTMDISLDFTLAYDGDKLMNIYGKLQTPISFIPIPNAIVVTNQYNENDLLIETKTELDITGIFYVRMKQKYDYNSENNITVMTKEYSRSKTSSQITGKTSYFYNSHKSIDTVTIHLDQNIPNPANSYTSITYEIPADGQATLSIYTINGQLLSSQSVEAKSGQNTLDVNTNNLASGIYFYFLEFNGQRTVKKLNINR
ncbi:MAG: T9SS type A sorting domain-containing protein [Bacteroidales bacterium]|jgi:hypothetical protein|nr:T9SS type A sorting domain-containing protein [Bacteroidales bacterium]